MTVIAAMAYLHGIVGKQCEVADTPVGSIIHLDFGALGKRLEDGPQARNHGEYCLTVQCPWRLTDQNQVVCDWNAEGGSLGEIAQALATVVGATVVEVQLDGPGWDIRLRFSNGKLLQVFSDTDPDDHAWFLMGIDGTVVKARPSTRTGGGLVIVATT